MEQSYETVKTSHGLRGDTDKLRDYYGDWANEYDKDVAAEGYRGPAVIADIATAVARGYFKWPSSDVSILDAGCGTGLAGIELKKRGFKTIDGFDLSGEMTDIARETGAYDRLAPDVDLNTDHENRMQRQYKLMICCGVLTLGHVEPEALLRLADYLEDGGIMIISTRNSYLEGSDYRTIADRVTADGRLEDLGALRNAAYIDEEGAHYWIYRKPAKA